MTKQIPDGSSNQVLVLAPFGRDSELLSQVLSRAGIGAEACHSVEDLCQGISQGVGSVLIADEALNQESMQALESCLQDQEPWSDLPVFVMTHQGDSNHHLPLKNLEPLGNVTILERPLRSETLISAFRMGLRARAHQYQLRGRLEAERRTMQALGESERRYRELAESLPLLVWTCSPDGKCDYLSRQWIEFTGVTEEAQLGFKWLDMIHPEDRSQTDQAWAAAYKAGAQYDVEFRLRRHDGQYRWFKTRGVPVKNSLGNVQKWFGSCTDIEDQKRISEDRRELLIREQKARELAELLNRVGPMLLEELDSQRLTQKVTDLATRLTGAQFGAFFQNLRGRNIQHPLLYAASGSLPAAADVPAPDFTQEDTLVSGDITRDRRFPDYASVTEPPVRSYLAAPVVSRSGDVLGTLVFGSNEASVFEPLHVQLAEGIAAQAAIALDNARLFAEAERSQETLKRSNAELRRANEDLNQFAYSASHDLQEPLRMVALYSQMMQRQYKDLLAGPGAEYLNYLIQGARRMEMLLRDLLDYTQVVSGNEERPEATDANRVFQDALDNLNKPITETNAVVTKHNLPVLAVKEVHLLQLFQNLISNALKYRSSTAPRIDVSARCEGPMWQVSVRDNGLGIAPEYTRQVFGLFKRLHGNSHYEGTGIGLAICQKIVERYGGSIWVESEGEGKGSTFVFTLPAGSQGVGIN